MKENTVYLLYNTNSSDIKVHRGLKEDSNREWEYEDKDEFTIMFSPEDERKYTDIKILSKTKLKERPKSADQLMKNRKVNVEGIFMRRSNSFPILEEDLLVLRRCPQIKPLLSETEIRQLQLLLEECRRNKQGMDRSESNMNDGLDKLFPGDQDFNNTTGDTKGTRLYESTKEMPSRRIQSASPQGLFASKAKGKAKRISHVAKNDETVIKTKPLDKWEKNPILDSNKFKKGENKNNLTGATQEVKPKKQNVTRTRSKSVDRSKYDKRKSKSEINDDGTKKHRTKKSEPQLEQKKSSKMKKSPSHEDEENEKKQRHPKKDYVKTKKETDSSTRSKEKKRKPSHEDEQSETKPIKSKNDYDKIKKDIVSSTRSKENISDQDQLNKSTDKTLDSKQKESNKKSDSIIKSKDVKTKIKKSIDNERNPKMDKTDKTGKRKPIIDSDKLSKDEKTHKSSTPLSSTQNVVKGKTETKTLDLLAKQEDGKSTQPKSSPSDKSKTTNNKTGDLEGENSLAKKGKNKDKLSPTTIQYMIHYILSNPIFLSLGWTLQPTKKALSRIVTFKAVPANPQSYCFRTRDNVQQKFYPSGTLALNIAEDGIGRINYPDGAPAIIMKRSHGGMKLTLYSCPAKDPLVKDSFYTRILGMFDSFGNGVVYSNNGKKMLNFNQMEGIYYNSSKQTPYKWQWSCFKVLEKQRLKELLNTMVNELKSPVPTAKAGKVVRVPSSGSSRKSVSSLEKKPVDRLYEALLEELPYPVIPKPKIKMKSHSNAFKSIILKINKEITLRINGQDSVAVNFSAKTLSCKMDLGVRIDPESVERVDEVADDRVVGLQSVLEDLLHPSPSLQKLHQLLDPKTLH